MQNSVLFLIVAGAVGGMVFVLLFRWREGGRQDAPAPSEIIPRYRIRQSFLDPQYLGFYAVLKQVFAKRALIFPKVRLAELLEHPGYDQRVREHWLRVQRRSVDFLICDQSLTPILAIKLGSHLSRRNKGADDVLEDSLAAADLPLLRMKLSDAYQVEDVTNRIKFAMAQQELNPGMHQTGMYHAGMCGTGSMLPGEEKVGILDSHFPKFKRWTSDLWMAARTRRVH